MADDTSSRCIYQLIANLRHVPLFGGVLVGLLGHSSVLCHHWPNLGTLKGASKIAQIAPKVLVKGVCARHCALADAPRSRFRVVFHLSTGVKRVPGRTSLHGLQDLGDRRFVPCAPQRSISAELPSSEDGIGYSRRRKSQQAKLDQFPLQVMQKLSVHASFKRLSPTSDPEIEY